MSYVPRKVAILLSSLEQAASAALLREVTEPLRSELQETVSKLAEQPPHEQVGVLTEFTCFVVEQLGRQHTDGPKANIQIVDYTQNTGVDPDETSGRPTELTQHISFEDIIELDDRWLDVVLDHVDRPLTVRAMQSADARWRQRVLDRLTWSESKEVLAQLKALPQPDVANANRTQREFCAAVASVIASESNLPELFPRQADAA